MAPEKTALIPYRMTAKVAEKTIHDLAVDSANVIWSGHCDDRSEERDISYLDALNIMRSGMVIDQPVSGKRAGEWKCKIVMKLRDNRDAGVVTVIMTKSKMLKVVTVEWEDMR